MNPVDWALVVLGGMVGAPARYLLDRLVQSRHDSVFPWGTLMVNILGSLVLGAFTGALLAGAAGPRTELLVGVGLCGAFTTYSTFSYETLRLAESGARRYAAANVLACVAAGVGAAYAGTALAGAVWG